MGEIQTVNTYYDTLFLWAKAPRTALLQSLEIILTMDHLGYVDTDKHQHMFLDGDSPMAGLLISFVFAQGI